MFPLEYVERCKYTIRKVIRYLTYAQLNPGPNIVLIGRQILIGRFFFKFVNGTNGFFKINIYI